MITLLALSLLLSTRSPLSGATLTFDSLGPVHIGMSVAEFRQAAGKSRRGDPPAVAHLDIESSGRRHTLVVETDGRIVRKFIVGTSKAVEYAYGCL